jgi:two-component system NtrC family sensor kinase
MLLDIGKKAARFLKDAFYTIGSFSFLSRDFYKTLKIRIIIIESLVALIPLIIVLSISYFWFHHILKEEFQHELKWQIGNSKQSIESFLDDKLAALRFFSSAYTFEQLSDQEMLTNTFSKFKSEFAGFIDLGVIDSRGIQRSYVGPYKFKGKDYTDQDWFQEVAIRSSYISDVFLGYRKTPHFAIAIKKEFPDKSTFWVLRATIDVQTLQKYMSAINLRENDDAFIIDKNGILQTPSLHHGNVLGKITPPLALSQKGTAVVDTEDQDGHSIIGHAPIKDTPWFLVARITSRPYARIPQIFKSELFLIVLFSVSVMIIVNILITNNTVNRVKTAEHEREDAMAKAEHANKLASIGRLASGVAHEINNPLAIINEKAGLMKDLIELSSGDSEKDKEKILPLFQSIFQSVDRCRTITQRLLRFSRQMDDTPEEIDTNRVIKEALGFLEKEILFRNIALELNLAKELPQIKSHKGQLHQVLLNIMNNSLDAMAKRGGTIRVSSGKTDDTIQVSISDNGQGMSKDVMNNIFEPFYTTKKEGKGTGLGLFISYGIIRKMGGSIHVKSEINVGTTFTVEIPINSSSVKEET